MSGKMTILGIGPRLAEISIPYLILTVVLTKLYPGIFELWFIPRVITIVIGILLLIIGLIFYGFTVKIFFKEYKEGILITKGTFSVCRNPIYTTFILFIIPSISLLVNSWLVLTSAVFLYMIFKVCIKKEYNYLRNKFGNEYDKYEKSVNEIFPFPRREVKLPQS